MQEPFKIRFLHGACKFDEIDDYIEAWHTGPDTGVSLQQFLGLSEQEYAYFMKHGYDEAAQFLLRRKNDLCNPHNSCMGGYGNCLDVKITNRCNAGCSFCIERGGYAPDEKPVEDLIRSTVLLENYPNVLILGGEPLLYPYLEEYLQGIRPHKENIYLTTNGILLGRITAEMLSKYLNGINISLHYFNLKGLAKLTGKAYNSQMLLNAFQVFVKTGLPVRINCNLVKGGVDSTRDTVEMITFAEKMGASAIRFSELQNAESLWVDAQKLFPDLTDNPYCDGCEQQVYGYKIPVTVKMTCGIVNRLKPPVTRESKPTRTTKVLYPDASVKNGWISPHSDGCHQVGCH